MMMMMMMMMLVHRLDIVRIYPGHPTTFILGYEPSVLKYGFIIIQNWMALGSVVSLNSVEMEKKTRCFNGLK